MRRLLAAAFLLIGCSNSHSDNADAGSAGSVDAALPADLAGGEVSTVYPAFKPEMPQLTNMGGPILNNPKLIAVTFPNDDLQKQIEDFTTKIGSSSYFSAVTAEYGISGATAGTPIHLTEMAPASIDDSAIATWIQGKIDGTTPAWNKPDANTLYLLFYPAATTITMGGGTSCQDFGGYHIETTLTDGSTVVYAVIPRCAPYNVGVLLTDIDMLTAAASHEIVEATEDPQPDIDPAFSELDSDHVAWTFSGGAEAGDLCALDLSNFYKPTDLGYVVQRTYSNVAASAYHDPCVPAPTTDVYFNAVPVTTADVDMGQIFSENDTVTKGFMIAQGASATIEVDLLSDGPTTGPWTVNAENTALGSGRAKANLTFAWDRTTGQNGEKLHLTVTVVGTSRFGFELFTITSTLGKKSYTWNGVVQVQ